jgi:hypothetical protein
MKQQKVFIGGKLLDLADLNDAKYAQEKLIPDNWPIDKSEGVRLFVSTQNMLASEFKRHLAHHFKKICKRTQEEMADGEPARIKIAFSFEIDQSAPTVAAIGETAMSFSSKESSKGKAKTFDINQGEFFNEDMELETLEEEANASPAPEPETQQDIPDNPPETVPFPAKKKRGKKAAAADTTES